jgi:hypothetical protein
MYQSQEIGPFETGKAFAKAVDDALESALVAHGFLRLRKQRFVFPVNDEFDGWIGLNRNDKYARFGSIDLHAGWGMHCPIIQRFTSECWSEKYKRGEIRTAPLGWNKQPTTRHFQFSATDDIAQRADEVAQFYRNEVVPKMLEHASYDAIIPTLEENAPRLGGWDQSLLLAYQLAGQTEQAKRYVLDRRKACSENEQYAAYYQLFLSRFVELFGE